MGIHMAVRGNEHGRLMIAVIMGLVSLKPKGCSGKNSTAIEENIWATRDSLGGQEGYANAKFNKGKPH